jgi:hypothetical protein
MASTALATRKRLVTQGLTPEEFFEAYGGKPVPDPITFMFSPEWLDRGNLYPRQATLLKLVFLREDLFTEYDRMVLQEWMDSFSQTQNNGIQPDVMTRLAMLRAEGRKWFREILLVMGRRAGKGHISALAFAYVLWNYLAKGDPQEFYGVDRDKRLACFIFAGKKDQAKANLFADLYNVVVHAPCFTNYIANAQVESISIYAPHDYLKMYDLAKRGIAPGKDMATFVLEPKESTLMAGRGPASFMQGYDEMAHVVAAGANRSAEDVYGAATPSLDQFGLDAFIIAPSSPWQRTGQFYTNYEQSLELDEETGIPTYPERLMLQLTSWDIYKDWEIAHEIDLFPAGFEGDLGEYVDLPLPRLRPLKGSIQAYDAPMQRLEKANPDTFKVERRSQFANVMDAYLNEQKVLDIFKPWAGRLTDYGPPMLEIQQQGLLIRTYKAHCDPSSVNCNFGLVVAHAEPDASGTLHCVFDYIHHWDPADYPDHILDYEEIDNFLIDNVARKFYPDEITFDQYNSVGSIQKINKALLKEPGPKRVVAYERTATKELNWNRAEVFKAAINMGLVHAPQYDQLELELKFLQDLGNKVVNHPTTGPVQTKDVADCAFEVVYYFLGEQIQLMLEELGKQRIQGGLQGGTLQRNLEPRTHQPSPHDQFSDFGVSRRVATRQGYTLGRGYRQR